MKMNLMSGKKKMKLMKNKSKYWFTRDKMDKIIKVHDYLDSLPKLEKFFHLDQF